MHQINGSFIYQDCTVIVLMMPQDWTEGRERERERFINIPSIIILILSLYNNKSSKHWSTWSVRQKEDLVLACGLLKDLYCGLGPSFVTSLSNHLNPPTHIHPVNIHYSTTLAHGLVMGEWTAPQLMHVHIYMYL